MHILYLCLILFVEFSDVIATDPCVSAKLLPSLAKRNVGYKLKAGDTPICDYYLDEGWYKMGTFVLASSNKNCGTTYPWHMNGKCF